jgi:hypothetical protein
VSGGRRPVIVAVAVIAAATVLGRRLSYKVGGNVVVRCRGGHLFMAIWIRSHR